MSPRLYFQFVFLVLSLVVVESRHRRSRQKQRLFVAPQRFNRDFLQKYAEKAVEEFNKQTNDKNKYVLLGVESGRAAEESKSLEIVMKFGRSRCQKTEDSINCQEIMNTRTFKVAISKKSEKSNVEFKFQETKPKLPTTTAAATSHNLP